MIRPVDADRRAGLNGHFNNLDLLELTFACGRDFATFLFTQGGQFTRNSRVAGAEYRSVLNLLESGDDSRRKNTRTASLRPYPSVMYHYTDTRLRGEWVEGEASERG